ncbi:putative transcriptional regulatory protein TcrX [bacterium BMS3Abin15]|nr:putative transcriptional regulatory protein TcrX [bacterium BMS3Abin15]HDH07636.1 response regulator [Candidatus Moranbacteria bacterium]HDZ85849.1 response regulator [Candidatus Moranbacteria bacterium]
MDEKQNKTAVYYVEDEPDLVELCKIAFQINGFNMQSVATGEGAMEDVKKIINKEIDPPSAFILDILLPGISGMDILREIRKHKELNRIPIVLFTNYSDKKIRDEAENTENTEYVLKTDVIPTQLVKIVSKKIEESKVKYKK